MANYILKAVKTFWEGYDLSGRMHTHSLTATVTAPEDTHHGVNDRTYLPGLKGHSLTLGGYHDNATILDPDKRIEAELGQADTIITVCAVDGAEEDIGYCFKAATSTYSPIEGGIGDVTGFTASATGNGTLIRGKVMATGEETTSATGTGIELYGMTEGEVAYLCVHCYALDATSLDIVVQSDTTVDFDDDPTARSFSQAQFTAVGAQWLTFTAPADITTHDCWRVNSTLTGGNTTASYMVTLMVVQGEAGVSVPPAAISAIAETADPTVVIA